MLCPACGKEVADRDAPCPFCGSLASKEKPPSAQSLPSASFGAPPAMPGQPRRASGLAIASLIFGLFGLLGEWSCLKGGRFGGDGRHIYADFILGAVAGLVAVIFGHLGRRSLRRSGGRLLGEGMAALGLVLGYAVLGFVGLLVALLWCFRGVRM